VAIEEAQNDEFKLPKADEVEGESSSEVKDINSLTNCFGLEKLRKMFPNDNIRTGKQKQSYDPKKSSWRALRSAFIQAVKKVGSLMYPADPGKLIRDGFGVLMKQEDIYSQSEKAKTEFIKKMYDILPMILKKQKKGTPEYRVARALFQEAIPYNVSKALLNKNDITLSGWGRVQATEDLELLKLGGRLIKANIFHSRYDENVAIEAVKFILSERYCGLISWGQKHIKLDASCYIRRLY
jgi:hypothetical protein